MPDVLIMSAFEFCHPMKVIILMKSCDFPQHQSTTIPPESTSTLTIGPPPRSLPLAL